VTAARMTRWIAAALACMVGSWSSLAWAAVPGWATSSRVMRVDVQSCVARAEGVMQFLSGGTAVKTVFDANYIEIRSFSADSGVFVTCTAAPSRICNAPAGRLSILSFTSISRAEATRIRDVINQAIGDPTIIDCGPALRPVG
jgi:hypothetical protein